MTDRTDRRDRRLLMALVVVLVLGTVVRVIHLGAWDMWTDEVQTLRMAASGEFWFGPMYRTAPINFWLTGWAVDLLGADEVGLRAIPALAGIVTLLALYPMARRWVTDRAAVLATAVLALSFWHVAWSQTGRHFALQTLLVLGALHGFLLYWKEGSRPGLGLAAAALLAALFTHSSSGFYVAALLVVVLVEASGRVRSAPDLASGIRALWPRPAVAGLVLLGVLVVYLPIYLGVGTYILETRTGWNPPWNILGSVGFYVTPVVAAFAAGGALGLWGRDRALALTLVATAVVPVVLLAAASTMTIASAAYSLPSMVAVAVLAGAGCDGLLRAASGRRFLFLGACAVVAGLFLSEGERLAEYHLFQNGLKPRWAEAARYVQERRAPGEAVWAAEGDVAAYYLGDEGVRWVGDYAGPEDASTREGRGGWFILYLQGRPDLESMMHPTLRADGFPPGADFQALFPVRYGPKDRTLVVLHRDGRGSGRPEGGDR